MESTTAQCSSTSIFNQKESCIFWVESKYYCGLDISFSLQYNSLLTLISSLKNDCVKTALLCCPPAGKRWEKPESMAAFTTHRARYKRRPDLCVT